MSSRYLKIAGIIIAFLAAWNLLQSPALWESLFLFGASGVIPGTDTELSPGATMHVLAAALTLSILLIFHREVWRGMRRLFGGRRVPAVAPVAVAQEAAASAPVAIVAAMPAPPDPLHVPAAPKPKPVVVIRVPGRKGKLVHWYRSVKPMVRPALLRVAQAVRQAVLSAGVQMVRAWRWLEPRLRQFDRWIEKQLKSNARTRAVLQSGAGLGRSARAGREQLRSYLAKVSGK